MVRTLGKLNVIIMLILLILEQCATLQLVFTTRCQNIS